MNQDQLELFPAAPGTHGSGGRGVSKRAALVDGLIEQASGRGCTHLEISADGLLFVLPALVGRCAQSTYVALDSPSMRALLLQKHPTKGVLEKILRTNGPSNHARMAENN